MLDTIPAESYADSEALKSELKQRSLALSPDEARLIRDRLGRIPTLAELFVFDIEWSEHCSYKSSKQLLKTHLPTTGRFVIQGPEEDAGIVEFTHHNGARYGIVFAHESHNHPSQVMPFEGAATGVGGIVRDVDCMGASVIGVADSLRLGDPHGENGETARAIADGIVDGIYHYANALGIPNTGGETVFHPRFDDNCLVNVVALGILREDEIIHSRVPEGGEGYDLILIGKPTDRSGFGGASFASQTLDEKAEDENKGAVQVPDPFLKNVLLHHKANHDVRRLAKEKGIKVGMKDLGAGGIACCASEIAASAGYGIEIQLDDVHVSEENLPAEIILCAETQERYLWVVPPSFTDEVLRIYNQEWQLPAICSGAGARKIGTVTQAPVMRAYQGGEQVVDLPIDFVVEGIRYDRESQNPQWRLSEPDIALPQDLGEVLLQMLASPNLASKEYVYRHYDTEVQGNSFIRPGEADASVILPLDGCPAGVALSVDGNPAYNELSPFWGAAQAVAESMRNVAAVGATPRAFTDCLNYGNPERPHDFWTLEEGIKGLADAARQLHDPADDSKQAIPFVSGNVSLYNHSASGRSIPPSPIVACLGVIEDASKAITMDFKQPGNLLILVGERHDELGGSAYYQTLGAGLGANVPKVRYEDERGLIYGTIQAIDQRLALAAHDISNGGLLISAAEMLLAGYRRSSMGLSISLENIRSELRVDRLLFSESSGMLLEIAPESLQACKDIYRKYGLSPVVVGSVTDTQRLVVEQAPGDCLIDLKIQRLREMWRGSFGLSLSS